MNNFSLGELEQRASAGDARAQYELAAAYSSAGRHADADKWLKSSAALGECDALYTLATRALQSREGSAGAVAQLVEASMGGSTAAMRLLGVLYKEGIGVAKDEVQARVLTGDAAQRGDIAAMRDAAMCLFACDREDGIGAALLRAVAPNDPIAGAVYVRRTIAGLPGTETKLAREIVRHLIEVRYPNAPLLVDGLTKVTEKLPAAQGADIDWQDVSMRLEKPISDRVCEPEMLCEDPSVKIYRNAFTPEECEYVIASGGLRLAPSHTTDPVTGEVRRDNFRTSLTATLGPVDLDLMLISVNERLAMLAGQPHENGEFLSVLHYAAGQEYRPHYDWLPPGQDFERGGQRITTALLYLNEAYTGGETHFLTPGIKFRGRAGDVIVFENILPNGAPDRSSRHASLPVISGAKWLGSRWFRERKYNF